MVALLSVLSFPLSFDIKSTDYIYVVITGYGSRPSDVFWTRALEDKRRAGLLVIPINGSTQPKVIA